MVEKINILFLTFAKVAGLLAILLGCRIVLAVAIRLRFCAKVAHVRVIQASFN